MVGAVHADRLVRSPVNAQIGLSIAGDIVVTERDASAHRMLEERRLVGVVIEHTSRKSNENGREARRGHRGQACSCMAALTFATSSGDTSVTPCTVRAWSATFWRSS